MQSWVVCIRDKAGAKQFRCSEFTLQLISAALSSDPATFEELNAGTRRFVGNEWNESFLLQLVETIEGREDSFDFAIDLPGKLIVGTDGERGVLACGGVMCDINSEFGDYRVDYHLAPDWEFGRQTSDWTARADERRERRERLWVQARNLMYDGLAGGLVDLVLEEERESRAKFLKQAQGQSPSELNQGLLKVLRELNAPQRRRDRRADVDEDGVHARWLVESRDELEGQTLREYLISWIDHIELDLVSREDQWLISDLPPTPLNVDASAYRLGPPGAQEYYLYHLLVESMIQGIKVMGLRRDELETGARETEASSADGPFQRPSAYRARDELIGMATQHQQSWLQREDVVDLKGLTPAQVIELERRRIPLTTDARSLFDDQGLVKDLTRQPMGDCIPEFWHADDGWIAPGFVFSPFRCQDDWEGFQVMNRRRDREIFFSVDFHAMIQDEP